MANISQSHFRFGKEELLEATHGWWQNEDTDHTQLITADWAFLLRFCEQVTTAVSNVDAQFQYNKNGAGWVNITTTSSVVKAVASVAFTDGQACTKRLSGTGTFETTGAGCTEDGLSGGTANDIVLNGNSETEAGLLVVAADVANGDTIQFHLTSPDGTMVYTITPTLTITKSDPKLMTPATLDNTISFYVPIITALAPKLMTPDTLGNVITLLIPTITVSDFKLVTPDTLDTIITFYEPTVEASQGGPAEAIPETLVTIITLYEPTVTALAPQVMTPPTLELVITLYESTVSVTENITVVPSTLELVISTYMPIVTASVNQTVVPDIVGLTTYLYNPTVSVVENTLITPEMLSLLLTSFTPVLKLKINPPVAAGKSVTLYTGLPANAEVEIP